MLSEKMCRSICEHPKLLQGGSEALQRDGRKKHGWSKSCRGRLQGRRMSGGWWPKGRNHHHHPRHLQKPALSLRPVNVKGRRVRGMQAPKNTNQFLMHEKYEMLHMRCDSVGSDSGCSSDSDTELTDMDSYLGVLENARGALLDSPNPYGSTSPPGQFLVLHEDPLCVHEGSLLLHESSPRLQEESMQYFPSEDDLMQSQNFMQRDFVEFYDILTP